MSHDVFSIHKNGPVADDFPVDIKFGEVGVASTCSVCRRMHTAGLFVIYKNKFRFCCILCVVLAVKKYQDLHPTETLLEFDIDASANDYKYAVKALREKYPDMDEAKAEEVARTVVRAIG
jgi:hypothetical protein